MAQLKVTQVKSTIGTKQNQRETLRSLGLKRIRQTVVARGHAPRSADMITPCATWWRLRRSSNDMTIKVHHLRPAPGAKTAKTRVGRGEGSKGKTAGRGTKGTKARKNVPAGFEGGQMPLHMRLPKLKGFKNRFRTEYQVVNVGDIAELFPEGGDGRRRRAGRRRRGPQGPAGQGSRRRRARTASRSQVTAHKFSGSAKEKITAAGGTATTL